MRFHPAIYQNYRQAAQDDVLPLSKPIRTYSGDLVSQLPIPKGMKIIASIAGYHRSGSLRRLSMIARSISLHCSRNQEMFGEDAHAFNPDRWLRKDIDKKAPSLGVYGNLYDVHSRS